MLSEAYRMTPFRMTRKGPPELMFGGKVRFIIPSMDKYHTVKGTFARETGKTNKEIMKAFADMQQKSRPSNLMPGDRVVLIQEEVNKLSTRCSPKAFIVI